MTKPLRLSFLLFIFCIILQPLSGQKPAFLTDYNGRWVDSVFNTLTLDQKIGQLLMPRGNFSGKPHDVAKLESWVKEYKIGGIVFFASNPTAQVTLTNHLQTLSDVPLFIGQDFEWGVGMRLDSTDRFPYAVTIGAMQGNSDWIERMGVEVAKQCKRIGVHINYAPVVDVNINPNNPVINFRSFGSEKINVAEKGLAYMKGMNKGNLLCTAKHFPGHGDTDVDSHNDLPLISHDIKRMHDVELYPFKKLIDNGLSGVMIAHLNIPSLDATSNLASTFSSKIVQKLLKEELKFEGLAFTDAMDMEGAVKNFPKGEAMVQAILAGNDVLETFLDVPTSVNAIKEAVLKGRIPMAMLDSKVKKILKAKSWVGLDRYTPIQTSHLFEDLNTAEANVINHYITEQSTTCLKNDMQLLPIRDLTKRIAVVSLDGDVTSSFIQTIQQYITPDYFYIPKNASDVLVDSILMAVKNHDIVIFGIHLVDIRASKKYGLSDENMKHMAKFVALNNVVTCLLANPFTLSKISNIDKSKSLILGYQSSIYTEKAAAQSLFGAIPTIGRLPVTINNQFIEGMGVQLPALGRLSYGPPEMVGINSAVLNARLDSLIDLGLSEQAYPGCVLEVAKEGRVIFSKAYGYHTYEDASNDNNRKSGAGKSFVKIDDAMDNFGNMPITPTVAKAKDSITKGEVKQGDLYDLASITKISTSTLAVMQLMSEQKFDLDARLADYYPDFEGTNKADLRFRNLLTHTSGLKAWIAFWKDAIDTTATMKMAVELHPEIENKYLVIIKKPNFFKRLFGKKTTKEVDYMGSLAVDPGLWQQVLTPKSLVWKPKTFVNRADKDYPVQITNTMWMHKDYQKVMMRQIADSPLNIPSAEKSGLKYKYVYSDLHFYLYPEMISKMVGKSWEDYLDDTYSKLGANSLTYNPSISLDHIVPTEYDSLFRQQTIHGSVHDEGAIMLGGISGHAGLFGNANDLMKLMQMYLRKGTYGGYRFIAEDVMNLCTAYQFPDQKIRRGIGFDKLDFDPSVSNGPRLSSPQSYGHSGFTGTFTWVDPKYDLVYVFLSNRVYPTRNNNKISQLNIRTEIGNQIIKSISK